MRAIRIVAIGGTRPEAIKLAPLIRAMRGRPDVEFLQVATGQHPVLFHQALREFGIDADIDLALPHDDAGRFSVEAEQRVAALLTALRPDLVLIQGDTNSAWAAARAAHRLGLPVGHVEAGLRSGDPAMPWPEERNRREIDGLSTLLFAPSAEAAANLAGHSGRVTVTGNTVIDALNMIKPSAPSQVRDAGRKLILVTAHRRETIPELPNVCRALLRLAERNDVELHFPLHPNPAVTREVTVRLGGQPRIILEPPLPYAALIALLCRATIVLTDSGGLQEEAPALGIPALIMRTITERPEVVASGNVRLVGLDPDRIVAETIRLLDASEAYAAMATAHFPYGDGDAAERIIAAIDRWWATSRSG
ncbi:non-hydrolyzing UDP-N-acetylglucosamine 2-epimerase [Sphingomonas bacterium]|uniref:non-hydrolyzing UDP-N-acetylglucosamine 2-epimerase n=1 Tax=Sphingomonas bacterium TaxID=1895847 RepID=UPI001C2D6AD7|nr:UDP-N-acetylglucosamine 2-epimerase (non-hydrolyzing) [Sphingomonas bacterium]